MKAMDWGHERSLVRDLRVHDDICTTKRVFRDLRKTGSVCLVMLHCVEASPKDIPGDITDLNDLMYGFTSDVNDA